MLALIVFIQLAFCDDSLCPQGAILDTVTGKCVLCEEGYGIISGKCKICTNFEGIRSNTGECGQCLDDECIDPKTRKCTKTLLIKGHKDPESKLCYCSPFEGQDSTSRKCTKCDTGKGVDEKINECKYCSYDNKGIESTTGKCIKCPKGQAINSISHMCQDIPINSIVSNYGFNCPTNQGVDLETNSCIEIPNGYGINSTTGYIQKIPDFYGIGSNHMLEKCYSGYGIDPVTFKCTYGGNDERCINPYNGILISYPPGTTKDNSEYFCQCETGQILTDDLNCQQCKDGYGVDKNQCVKCGEKEVLYDGRCRSCLENSYEALNPDTKICESCANTNCISQVTEECIPIPNNAYQGSRGICTCNDNYFFNNETLECVKPCPKGTAGIKTFCAKCPNDQCIDEQENTCRKPNSDEIIDKETNICFKCPNGKMADLDSGICIDCSYDECISTISGRCIKMINDIGKDSTTNLCKCPNKKVLKYDESYCVECESSYAIDPDTLQCKLIKNTIDQFCADPDTNILREYRNNEGYRPTNYECIQCPNDAQLDNDHICKCPAHYGMDYTTDTCIQCEKDEYVSANGICSKCPYGLAIENDKCVSCRNDDKCIDENKNCVTNSKYKLKSYKKCVNECPQFSTENGQVCSCDPGYFETEQGVCQKCPDGETSTGGFSKSCEPCSSQYDRNKCLSEDNVNCLEIKEGSNFGYDFNTGKCINCPENAVSVSGSCKCKDDGYGINSEYTQCIKCEDDEIINENGQCTKCKEYECKDEQNGVCKKLDRFSSKYKDPANGKCVDQCEDGYDYNLHICGQCAEGSTVSSNKQCKCPQGTGVVEGTEGTAEFKCQKCPDFYEIDGTLCVRCNDRQCFTKSSSGNSCKSLSSKKLLGKDGFCVSECPSGTGIMPNVYKCVECTDDDCSNKCVDIISFEWREIGAFEVKDVKTSRCNCKENLDYSIELKKCICKNNKEVPNEDGTQCNTCNDGFGIDIDTQTCKKCNTKYGVDPTSGFCVLCEDGKGIHQQGSICKQCNENECIDKATRECIAIPESFTKSDSNAECEACLYPNTIDTETGKCICPHGKGYDKNFKSCEICDYGIDKTSNECKNCFLNDEGIDHESKICRKCTDDEGIDLITLECSSCTNGVIPNLNTVLCKCPPKFGFNSDTIKCEKCKNGEGIDPETNTCGKCSNGGIDPISGQCKPCPKDSILNEETLQCECEEKKGIDVEKWACVTCNIGEGINSETLECGKCPDNQGIDSDTLKCVKCSPGQIVNSEGKCAECPQGQGFDSESKSCKKCSDNNCIKCTNNINVCTSCNEGFKVGEEENNKGKCISNNQEVPVEEIEILKPTETPIPENINLILDESGNLKIPTSEQNKNKIYVTTISDNGKTITIEDEGQSQIGLNLQDTVDKITVIQNSNKPLEIIISRNNNKKVEVAIDNPQLTTIKGNGEVTLVSTNQQNNQIIELEQISPSFDNDLKINSDSKIQVKQIDLYGKSKVEFGQSVDAKVKSFLIQQKAETSLQNVNIEEYLYVGLQSVVTINDNVILSGATIELSYTNIAQKESLIKGNLNSVPQSIKIENRKVGDYLDNNEFHIAESSSDTFECEKWAESFDKTFNEKFNRAICLPKDENGYIKLIADNNGKTPNSGGDKDKGGLKPGVIAAIVIVVIVVVAVIIILVWFFVFHKKKMGSSQDEDSNGNNADEI